MSFPHPRRLTRTWLPTLERLEDRTVPSFLPPLYLPTGEVTIAVAVSDFNVDGRHDFIVANRGEFPGEPGNNLEVFLGRGNGTFEPGRQTIAGENPTALAVEDFNWDGLPDVASASYLSASISVMLGRGDGFFHPPAVLRVGILPRSITAGDFNNDGWWDLATGNVGETTVSIMLNNADGTFQSARTFEVNPDASPAWVQAAFINNDWVPDLVVVDDFAGTVSVLLNNGDATFQPPVAMRVQQAPRGAAVDDFNFDGNPDLVVVNQLNSTASVLLGNGGASFRPAVHYPTGDGPQHVITVDVNLDGLSDLVTANIYSNVESVLLGNGDGTFRPVMNFYVNDYGAQTAVGYFNDDYYPDLVIARADDPQGEAVVLINAAAWPGGSPGGGAVPTPDGLLFALLPNRIVPSRAEATRPAPVVRTKRDPDSWDRTAGSVSNPTRIDRALLVRGAHLIHLSDGIGDRVEEEIRQ